MVKKGNGDLKSLIVTHIDLDGSGVALMFKLARPQADILYVNYDWEKSYANINKLISYDEILFGDISFSREFAQKLNYSGKRLVLYDHHESALKELGDLDYDWITINKSKCGTLLVYDALKSLDPKFDVDGTYKVLAKTIDDYDRWILNDPKSLDLQFLWSSLGRYKFLDRFLANPSLEFTDTELELILKKKEKLDNSITKAKRSMSEIFIDREGLKFVYCTTDGQASLVANNLLKVLGGRVDYIAISTGSNTISLRSESAEVSTIAEDLGGGGHKLAAGFTANVGLNIIESIKNRTLIYYDYLSKFVN